jgi:ATP-dependent exoDNAse (exonuclease V) beta subunit
MKPGLHEFSDYGVVWWDPGILRLKAPPPFGVRQEDLLSKDVEASVVESDAKRYAEWVDARDEMIETAGTPSLRIQTATERAALLEEETVLSVEVVEVAGEAGRPSGVRFGSLVHAILAAVPLDADVARCSRVSKLQGRILGATPEEVAAAGRAVAGVLKHPIVKRARRACEKGLCRRETPLTLRVGDGTLVDGVVDLAFLEDDVWTVIDFKTDRELERGLETYRRQVGLYAEIIAKATGRRADAVLMRV